MISKQLILALVLILALAPAAFAQKPTAPPLTEEQRKAQEELEHKVLTLLDDVIKEGDSFKHAENRIQIKAASAYLLWKHDEARARILFRDVIASFAGLLNTPADTETPEGAKMVEGTKMLRAQILQMLATCDARMAREFMRATRLPSAQPGTDGNLMADPDLQTDLNLAEQIASTDPKLAVEIAEESLSKGFPDQLPTIVSALRAKDPEAAAKLAGEIMAKLHTQKLAANDEARQVAVSLLRLATETPEGEEKGSGKKITPLLEQSDVRELTEMVAAEALRGPGNEDMLASLQSMMPVVEKYAPARAEQLRRKVPQKTDGEEGGKFEEGIDWGKYRPLIEKGSSDELLTAASKTQSPTRDMLYQFAMSKMIKEGDMDHARQLINEKVADENQRKSMLEQIDQAAATTAAEQGKVDQTRKMLASLHTNEERVMLLAQLALGAGAKGEKKIALKLLDEASGMINQRAKNINQLGAQLMVAHAYIQLDPSRSFAILEPIVDQLNELLGAAAILGGFFIEELVRDDEIMLGPIISFLSMTGGEFGQYLGDLSLLARADFERTKNLVDKFQRDEVRIVMRLILAQSILAPLPASKGLTTTYGINGITVDELEKSAP